MILHSSLTGQALVRRGHALEAAGERWPLVDGIAFLRADRRDLARDALALLDQGDTTAATVLLLADQDNWATTPPPSEQDRHQAVMRCRELTFRDAMELLALGPVATYFAHRWSDPTFLSGLALAQSFAQPGPEGTWFELACGAGHYLRAIGPHAAGGDIVFAKLWLARHFIAPHANLICFDAAQPWPLPDGAADTLFCHDAFYFLPDKPFVAREMRRTARRVLIGHAHNALTPNLSSGQPLSPGAYAALFPGCLLFDDAELTASLIECRAPEPEDADALGEAPAVALAWQAGQPARAQGRITAPVPGTALRRNPLYRNGRIAWPSDRYAREYASLVTYPEESDAPDSAIAGQDSATDTLARRRVLLDLPARW